MSAWWTYSLQDLLLFSPRTYYRLFELYNLENWPLQWIALGLGIAVLLLWRLGGKRAGLALGSLLALSWLWIAWAYHWQQYASINWAANYFAVAWLFQAVIMLWAAVRGDFELTPTYRLHQGISLLLLLLAMIYPLLAVLQGRSWAQAEMFGMMPDPTALATLAILLRADIRRVKWLFPLPILWCLISGATLWTMQSPEFMLLPIAALMAVGLAIGLAIAERYSKRKRS